jgi:hypothetical protein
MTTRTRYFVIVSLLMLGVGLGSGLVAYYVGFPAGALGRRGGPEELEFVPRDAAVIAFANVHEIMTSDLRQKLHRALPMPQNGQQELQNQTGINLETDVDRIVACVRSEAGSTKIPGAGMVLARGRFDEVKIEALMREHGAHVEDYNGKRLIVADARKDVSVTDQMHHIGGSFALSFIEPGLAAFGTTTMIKSAVDLHRAGNNPQAGLESVTGNDELMNLVRSMNDGNAWAVGRFDALRTHARLPESVASQIPAITWFAVNSHINGGIRGVIRAEARDDEAANNLRDVVRGFLALAKLQSGSKPELQTMMQSLELGGAGKTVSLSFTVPSEVFDLIGAFGGSMPKKVPPQPQAH